MAGDGHGDPDPGRLLAELGASLCAQLVEVVPDWIVREVERIVDAWDATRRAESDDGGEAAPTAVPSIDRVALRLEARDAGRRAAADIAFRLRGVLAADVDAQSTTPLEVVRGAVVYPTDVLERAGVPPVVRDAYDEVRFPDDVYGLTPASLGAVDAALPDLARAWGVAKAMAHEARHGRSHA